MMRRLPWLLLAALYLLTACATGPKSPAIMSAANTPATPSAATAIDPMVAPWPDIVARAQGKEVAIYMWGGSDSINTWMDTYVAPAVKQQYGVTLRRVPVNNTGDVITKLLGEKRAERSTGSVDLVWVNGENFKTARQGDLLWGPFADRLPSFTRYYDTQAPDVTSDFGFPVDGFEAPWGKAQFVMAYDSAMVKNPPRSFAELAEWVKENPGRFTYPAPHTDFTGSAFIRIALYETTGGYEQYLGAFDQAKLEANWTKTFDYLNGLKPYLWRKGATYPESLAKLDQLYADGEVWMSMHYNPAEPANLVAKGIYPATTRTFVFDSGTIANTHFLAIPFNAPQKEAAMVVADLLLSPEAQLSKFDTKNWGDFPAFDPAKVPAAIQEGLSQIDLGEATLPPETLAKHRVPEIGADYLNHLQDGWKRHVGQAK